MPRGIADNRLFLPLRVTFATLSTVSLWNNQTTPAVASNNDGNAVELGSKFQSDTAGYVQGVRFYKGTNNTGTHTGKLWTSSGSLLASVTFTNETASGWQQMGFPSPVSINANTIYVISYHAPNGRYAINNGYFNSSGFSNGSLQAPSSASAGGNGVYRYGPSAFPNSTFNGGNYWVDVVFATSPSSSRHDPTRNFCRSSFAWQYNSHDHMDNERTGDIAGGVRYKSSVTHAVGNR